MALLRGLSNQERLAAAVVSTSLSNATTGQLVVGPALVYAVVVSEESGAGTSARMVFLDTTATAPATGNADTFLTVYFATGDTSRTKKVDFNPPYLLTNTLKVFVTGTGMVAAQNRQLAG